MSNIHEMAVRNFEAAADLLMTLQNSRVNLVTEVTSCLLGKPKILLNEGYSALTLKVGICVPADARAELSKAEGKDGLEFRNSGLNWMSLESRLPNLEDEKTCYLDTRAEFASPVMADVFLRERQDDGGMTDSLHQEWILGASREALCRLRLPKAHKGTAERRIIIQLRQPPRRFSIESLALTIL